MNIGFLYTHDRAAWLAEFFPQYVGLPAFIRVAYFNPYNPPIGMHTAGQKSIPELTPWAFDQSDIQPNGTRFTQAKATSWWPTARAAQPVEEEVYRAWCNGLNYYLNGGLEINGKTPGLDPAVFIGAYDIRTLESGYYERDRYELVTGPSGTYTYGRGPSKANPFGVNATFTPAGASEPAWVSGLWGPAVRPDGMTVPGIGFVPMWDEARDGPRPSQEAYNAERTPQALGYL